MRRPNILVFVSHDTGRWLGSYGASSVSTPAFDALARESVQFNQAFCCSPLCSPSRAALFTGRHPHEIGAHGLIDHRCGWDLEPKAAHLSSIAKSAGYETCLAGFLHEVLDCRSLPFDAVISGPGEEHNNGRSVLEHGAAIGRWLDERGSEAPFYLQVGCPETHRDFRRFGAASDNARGVRVPEHMHDRPDVRDDFAAFQGSVRQLDEGFGRIMTALRERGILEDTIVVATTDHGIDYPRMKGTFSDGGLETFLYLRYPKGGWGQGQVCDTLVSNLDILPTLLAEAGLPQPENLRGQNLAPLLRGEHVDDGERELFAQKTFHDIYDPTRCVRTRRFKYICYFEKCIIDDLRLDTIVRSDWLKAPLLRDDDELLFDLENDPEEKCNLVHDTDYGDTLTAMRRRLARIMRETNDPLLGGPISSATYFQARQRLGLDPTRSPL
jgi:N-sulfoglucosamine sulfohydrolase